MAVFRAPLLEALGEPALSAQVTAALLPVAESIVADWPLEPIQATIWALIAKGAAPSLSLLAFNLCRGQALEVRRALLWKPTWSSFQRSSPRLRSQCQRRTNCVFSFTHPIHPMHRFD